MAIFCSLRCMCCGWKKALCNDRSTWRDGKDLRGAKVPVLNAWTASPASAFRILASLWVVLDVNTFFSYQVKPSQVKRSTRKNRSLKIVSHYCFVSQLRYHLYCIASHRSHNYNCLISHWTRYYHSIPLHPNSDLSVPSPYRNACVNQRDNTTAQYRQDLYSLTNINRDCSLACSFAACPTPASCICARSRPSSFAWQKAGNSRTRTPI